MLTYWDFPTKCIWAEPVKTKTQEDTTAAFRNIVGDTKKINMFYCVNHSSLKALLKELHILQRPSQPGAPQSNGVIEGLNHRMLFGTRASLIQAGLPICFWRFAMTHWCTLRNTHARR